MKGMDLASALTAPVPGRGAQQGARPRSEPANPDAGSFDAVLNDVHSVLPGKAPDADPARDASSTADADADSAQPAEGAAQSADSRSGAAQVTASIQGTEQNVLAAALTLPVTGAHELSATADASAGVAETPGPDPRLAIPGALRTGTTPAAVGPQPTNAAAAAAEQVLGMQPGSAAAAHAAAAQQSAAQPSGAQQPAPGTAAPLGTPANGLQSAASTAIPGDAPSQGVAAATATATATATVTAQATAAAPSSPVAPAAPAPAVAAVAAVGAATGFAAVATAEGKASGPARTENTPAAAPADALAAAGVAAAAAPPANQPTTAAAGAPAPQPAAQATTQPAATLQPQLAKPLFTLAGAPHGQHIMTLKVSPEDLGPMTVRAHIDAAGVRIELFAPGDAGREAIRGILPELRKELADAGFGASLDVSEHNGPGNTARDGTGPDPNGQGAGRDSGSGPGNRHGPGDPRPGHRWDALADSDALRTARILNGPQTTLDILV